MYKQVNTAKDRQGKIIKIGDNVEWIDIYTKKLTGIIAKVLSIHKQGYDGTILTCNKGADYNSIFKTCRASDTIKR